MYLTVMNLNKLNMAIRLCLKLNKVYSSAVNNLIKFVALDAIKIADP